MNIYFVENLETGRCVGDELEPMFERSFWRDYESAHNVAWARNVIERKNISSRNKYVVSAKEINCPIMYVKYDADCKRRFFSVHDAIEFYKNESSAYEIGYENNENEKPLDLTKDWKWTDECVIATKFDDSFWNSSSNCGFIETPGKIFDAYGWGKDKTICINGEAIKFSYSELWLSPRYSIKKGLRQNAIFTDEDGIVLTPKTETIYRYYDFGGSFADTTCTFTYPNGRLFGYVSLNN